MIRTYKCDNCGVFERYRNDAGILDKCPSCGLKLKQVLGLNFKLKVSGFYSTDNVGCK